MFENLYFKIGEKIKNLTKWIFIGETIIAIIVGIVLLSTNEYLVLPGILVLIIGPVIAFVSSWLLYAFGELVDKTCENEKNTKKIVKLLQEQNIHNTPQTESTKNKQDVNKKAPIQTHKWRCNNCGNMINMLPCQYCGTSTENSTLDSNIPYFCGKCGKAGPYEGDCPNCHSSLRHHNV